MRVVFVPRSVEIKPLFSDLISLALGKTIFEELVPFGTSSSFFCCLLAGRPTAHGVLRKLWILQPKPRLFRTAFMHNNSGEIFFFGVQNNPVNFQRSCSPRGTAIPVNQMAERVLIRDLCPKGIKLQSSRAVAWFP